MHEPGSWTPRHGLLQQSSLAALMTVSRRSSERARGAKLGRFISLAALNTTICHRSDWSLRDLRGARRVEILPLRITLNGRWRGQRAVGAEMAIGKMVFMGVQSKPSEPVLTTTALLIQWSPRNPGNKDFRTRPAALQRDTPVKPAGSQTAAITDSRLHQSVFPPESADHS